MLRLRERLGFGSMIASVIQIVLGLILLLSWLVDRRKRELAFLAGLLLCRSAHGLFSYVSIVADWPHISNAYFALGLSATVFFLVCLVLQMTGERLAWIRWLSALPFAGHLLSDVDFSLRAKPLLSGASWVAVFQFEVAPMKEQK